MKKSKTVNCLSISLLLLCFILPVSAKREVYIVIVRSLPQHPYSLAFHHSEFLKDIVPPSFAKESVLLSFKNFNGFTAKLTEKESNMLRRLDGVESVLPNRKAYLQTTHSWDYLGFSEYVERNLLVESDSIIGVIDSGIWPESESFNDDGLGPVPAKWKGVCQGGINFKCNRKIIGARSYIVAGMDFSPRDNAGHGTHVASIAAGRNVRDTSYYGIAQGIAKGGVPSARLAVYKVCDPDCHSAEILRAFDDAITDGVDYISISLNFNDTVEVSSDAIAIGALHAVTRGILTINSVGNGGPSISTITNYAPWIFTVAASGTDRKIVDKVLLGNYETLLGNGINAFSSRKGGLPIAYGEVSSRCSESDARECRTPCLERSLVDQKVVVCDKVPHLKELNKTGALSFIIPNVEVNVSRIEPYSVVQLSENELNSVKTYIDSTTEPRVQILKSEAIHNPGAPFVALFSSRGPSTFMPDIVKPDVTAPGVEILAAFSPLGSPSDTSFDERSVNYSILSGTSMACPHVTAAAVYVNSFNRNWSPSAIKSALMTTAREFDPAHYAEAEFAYGSGHIDPPNARNPGLVYETQVEDYFKIWCNLSRISGSFVGKNVSCSTQMTMKDLNYPSMAVQIDTKNAFTVSFPRTVTNVGQANSTYVAYIEGDRSKLHFVVEPSTLHFTELNQKMKFVVTVGGKRMKPQKLKRVSLVWTDGVHRVRSPIVVHTIGITSAGERVRTPPSCCITLAILLLVVIILFL